MTAGLAELAADHPHVGEVRGRGMMIGMEMVGDRESRAPAPELAGRLVVEGLRRGVLLLGGGIHGNVLSLSPPFVLTDAQADFALGVIGEILAEMR
jgi:4-aminobutyrate aminotransferase-like enzyme